MANPIVVFFDPNRAAEAGSWNWPVGVDIPPVGWTTAGEIADPRAVKTEYEILILDDTKSVKDQLLNSQHSNKEDDQPLIVVWHNNSSINTKVAVVEDAVLQAWGSSVFLIEPFSHVPSDKLFIEICNLIGGKEPASDFAESLRDKHELEFLEKLAAICQLRILDVDVNVNILEDEYLLHFPLEFRNRYVDSNTAAALTLVAERANKVASI